MKNLVYALIALAMLSISCGKGNSGPKPGEDVYKNIQGEWMLESHNGNSDVDSFLQVYLAFDSTEKTFDLYQKVEELYLFYKYQGTFKCTDTTISGIYADNNPWITVYQISFDETANYMTLTSESEVNVYVRTEIPEDLEYKNKVIFKTTKADAEEDDVKRFL